MKSNKSKIDSTILNRLGTYLNREPFRPWGVTLDSGEEFEFRRSNELGAPKRLGYFYYFDPKGGAVEITKEAVRTIIDLPTGETQEDDDGTD